MLPLKVVGTNFIDSNGRNVLLRGINLSGDSKLPKSPDMPSHRFADFWESKHLSFVDRPFPLDQADQHLSRIASWGYNVVRFVLTWEAIEHMGPGVYDDDYVDYVIALVRKCGEHGLYVLMDPHQDVWSRYSGGSGAPCWTFHAAGINPRAFASTEAALVHNISTSPEAFPKMIWSTNYDRMAAATMFVLFFAGKHFAPKAIIDGQNIEDSHFIRAMAYISKRVHEEGDLEDCIIIGWESLNEPSQAWIGNTDLSVIPADQQLRKGTCPSPFQAILLASGFPQDVQTWQFGGTGPKKTGSLLVDPAGCSIWTDHDFHDNDYGWVRDPSWHLGVCVWAQHGLWDVNTASILQPKFFEKGPDGRTLDTAAFLQWFWLPHFRRFKQAIRTHHSSAIIFCQPPVLKIPPVFSVEDKKDTQIVYAPHYYDGLTLINKTWNTWYNVDVLGVLRGRYLSPVFAVRLGLRAIRNCLRDQLIAIRNEGIQNMGQYPCFFTEIGIPFDMDDKRAYSDGNYESQIGALDANHFALEGANVNFTLWHYSSVNSHRWGDSWNGEDLSLYSKGVELERATSALSGLATSESATRAAEAFIRPCPVRTAGDVLRSGFDLKTQTFNMTLLLSTVLESSQACSEIYVPAKFPEDSIIEVTEGRVTRQVDPQVLLWWHDRASIGTEAHIQIRRGRGKARKGCGLQ